MKALVTFIARALVDDVDQVQVREVPGDGKSTLELTVAPGDLGKVIGRQGRTARAIRTFLSAAASKRGRHYGLEILD